MRAPATQKVMRRRAGADLPRGAGPVTAEEKVHWSTGKWLDYVALYARASLWAVGKLCKGIEIRALLHSVIGPDIRG